MNKEPNKPVEPSAEVSRELIDEELEGVVGGLSDADPRHGSYMVYVN